MDEKIYEDGRLCRPLLEKLINCITENKELCTSAGIAMDAMFNLYILTAVQQKMPLHVMKAVFEEAEKRYPEIYKAHHNE